MKSLDYKYQNLLLNADFWKGSLNIVTLAEVYDNHFLDSKVFINRASSNDTHV